MIERQASGTMNHRPPNWILLQIPEGTYAALQRHLSTVDLQVGTVLSEPDKPAEFVYLPLTGFISISVLTESGDSVEVAAVGHEGLVGVAPLIDQPLVPHVATVQGECSAVRIRTSILREEIRKDSVLLYLIHQVVYIKMLQMGQSALCNRVHSVDQRLARWLLTAADRMESNSLNLTQEYLAHMLGARRSTVTIAAGELQRAGLIDYTRGKIQITDRPGLEKAACECYGILRTVMEKFRPAGVRKS